jgi:hypothetical protein
MGAVGLVAHCGDQQIAIQLSECIVGGRTETAYTLATGSVRAAVSGDEELQGELVNPVVVLSLDPVSVRLTVLREQQQRSRVCGLRGEQQVEQDEGIRVPPVDERHDVNHNPRDHDNALR